MNALSDICAGSVIIVCTGWAIMMSIGLIMCIKDELRRAEVLFNIASWVALVLVLVTVAYSAGHYLRPILAGMFL